MKKRLLTLAALLLAALMLCLSLTGCAKKHYGPYNLLKDGVLQVGSEIGYPPFEMKSDDGTEYIGLDMELGKLIADKLGLKFEVVESDFETILKGLGTDRYDIVMSAITITPERKKNDCDFSAPYIKNWQAIVVKRGSAPVTSPEGLAGLSVAYQEGTTSFEYLKRLRDTGAVNCEVSEYKKILNCFDDLKLGRVDAVLCDSVVAEGYVARDPSTYEITWHQSTVEGEEPELFGIAIKQGNIPLQEAIDKVLAELEADGTMDQLRDEWLKSQ
ncbi:MAG: ABC transporter substrate-binding protein [Oscillospiraceae bacterium]|jgi:polar amino acid transport system substrate-binding protein|nr:ABC transporter substrate-binding protein [Oscillospiraceae bacterium]